MAGGGSGEGGSSAKWQLEVVEKVAAAVAGAERGREQLVRVL